jgi:F-type H+-transporting ATPase subunit delta
MSLSAKDYSVALFTAAKDPLQLRQELVAISEVVTGTPRAKQILVDVSLGTDAIQRRTVDQLFPKASRLTRDLLVRLVNGRELDRLPEIARAYGKLAAARLQVVDVEIESAYPLTPTDQRKIASGLPLDGRKPLITLTINKELIAGVRATVEGITYDVSLAGRLAELSDVMGEVMA